MTNYIFKSIIGNVEITAFNQKVSSVKLTRKKTTRTKDKLLLRAALQINSFLMRKRRSLTFPTKQMGTKFQRRVWDQLRKVPYGKTTSYGQIAKRLRTSPRAVGGALGRNNLMMSVPCHRVVAKDGRLTGFTSVGGIKAKRRLLKIENKSSNKS
tara:strand:- start:223 stop:684 length:462 start_codon:yes stop_codon:yes gene_type:complete